MPLAPAISSYYAVSPQSVSLLNIGYAISGFVSPFFGYLADKKGVKKMVVASIIIFTLGSFIVATGSKQAYIIGRLILGVGYYNLGSFGFTYSKLTLDEKMQGISSGLYKVAFALGAFLSPLMGAKMIEVMNFSTIYLYLGIAAVIITVLTFMLPTPEAQTNESINISDVKDIFKDKKAKLMLLSAFLLSVPAVFFYNYISINMSSMGMDQTTISSFYSMVALGSIAAGAIIAIISSKVKMEKIALVSSFLSGLAVLIIVFSDNMFLGGFIFGLFYDMIWGVFMPTGTNFYIVKGATFLTLLSFVTSTTNLVTNTTGPVLYGMGGVDLLLIVCSICLVMATFALRKSYIINAKDIENDNIN